MNRYFLQSEFEKFSMDWVNTESYNRFIYDYFETQTNTEPMLRHHCEIIENYNLGYGERAFRYFWAIIFSQIPVNAKFLEIGVFKGSILALSQLISNDQKLNLVSYGLSPLNNTGDKYSSYIEDDYLQSIKGLFDKLRLNMDNTHLIVGLSTDNEAKLIAQKNGPYDIVYIDGGHDYETVINDIKLSDTLLKPNGFLVMDDASSLLSFPPEHRGFLGHQDVAKAIKFTLDNDFSYKHLFACGHNRVWVKK